MGLYGYTCIQAKKIMQQKQVNNIHIKHQHALQSMHQYKTRNYRDCTASLFF